MKVNKLWDKFWKFNADENEEALSWIRKLLKKDPENIDFRHIYLQALIYNGNDTAEEQEEPIFMNLCTSVVREKDLHEPLTVAKAYSYRGEIKYHAVDRRKDFDKANLILDNLDPNDVEVKYLKQFIKLEYPFLMRQYLFIDRNYINMFKF